MKCGEEEGERGDDDRQCSKASERENLYACVERSRSRARPTAPRQHASLRQAPAVR